jgi:hypothetical protein
MNPGNRSLLVVVVLGLLDSACGGAHAPTQQPTATPVTVAAEAPRPHSIVLVDTTITFQARQEPWLIAKTFEFELPERPRRARLVLRYSGVPGALSESYTMGQFRDRVELNKSFLMDLNTFSTSEDQVVEYTKWIPVGMLRRHNQLTVTAGDNGDATNPVRDEFELRSAVLEFDW